MRPKPYEIVILKPTAAFLSFLSTHLAEIKLPDLRLLNIDNTAYVVPKRESTDTIFSVIQKNFPSMFQHEIKRWFGESISLSLEINFLDFLCCFKFEIYNHIVLMESSIKDSSQLLMLKPRQALLDWIRQVADPQEEITNVISKVELSHLQENATLVVKNFSNLTSITPFIKHYYQTLFSTAMNRLLTHSNQWPMVSSFQAFKHYFSLEIHTQLIHLPE